jgi:AhpD family alkylhydroperoxidase
MPLVTPIPPDQAPLLAQPFYGGGDPGPITASMAHVPELLERALPFIGAALSPSAIDFRTKEIVILRTSALLACRYCIDAHTLVALSSGLTEAEVAALRSPVAAGSVEMEAAFGDKRDRALLQWIDHVATGRGAIPADVSSLAGSTFAEHEIVELTLVIGVTMLLNRYATSLQLPVDNATLSRLAAAGFPSPLGEGTPGAENVLSGRSA